MPETVIDTDVLREAAGRSLLVLVRQHKATCENPDCTVTLSTLLPIYAAIVNRPPSDDERWSFL